MKKTLIVSLLVLVIAPVFTQGVSIERYLTHYMSIKDALVQSDAVTAQQHGVLLKAALHITDDLSKEERDTYMQQFNLLMDNAHVIADSRNIEIQRQALAKMSPAMWALVRSASVYTGNLYYHYCPMRKAYWISRTQTIENPYYGTSMLNCGSVKEIH